MPRSASTPEISLAPTDHLSKTCDCYYLTILMTENGIAVQATVDNRDINTGGAHYIITTEQDNLDTVHD